MGGLKLVDLHRQYVALKPDIDAAIANVLAGAGFIRGTQVAAFEQAFAGYLGVKHVIGCGSGTDALQIAYMALGIGAGDEVITTPFTFVATVEALVLLGACPVYVDIDPLSYNIDVAQVENAITSKTKAIVPVHLYGHPAPMDALLAVAHRYNLPVVEDAAQATGAQAQGHMVGTMGRIGCFSFFPAKNLGCFGDGGAVATDDDELANACRMIANHGSNQRYFHELIGINSRLDTLQAAVLLAKLPHLESFNAARIRVARRYDEAFCDLPWLITPNVAPNVRHVYQQYSVRTTHREAFAKHLDANEVPYAIHYPRPLHLQPAFSRLSQGKCFVQAETVAAEILSIPMFPELTDDEVDTIVTAVRAFVPPALY